MTGQFNGMRLPWTGRAIPHASLELLRGCNVACEGCYNGTSDYQPKPVSQLRDELAALMRLRCLQTLTLTGGEPLLHPDAETLIAEAHRLNLRTVLMSNGLLLDGCRARRLKAAGLDMVLLHIQDRQHRPDLPLGASADALRRLRRDKTAVAGAAGLEVGFSAALYPDARGHAEIRELLDELVASENVNLMLVCPLGDFAALTGTEGELVSGYRQPCSTSGGIVSEEHISDQAEALYRLLGAAGFARHAWVGSSANEQDPRWSAWHAGVLRTAHGMRVWPLPSAWADVLLMRVPRLLTGRHIFHQPASLTRFRLQLACALLDWRRAYPACAAQVGSLRAGTQLQSKHVVVELPPVRRANGAVVICRECPNATMRDGRLVPPCLADRLTNPAGSPSRVAC